MIIWSILLLILVLFSILIVIFYRFYEYELCIGYVKKIDGYKVVLYLEEFSLLNNHELYLENEKVEFSVYSISSDYYIINNKNYYEIVLSLDLKESYKIENNILNLKFNKGQTTYYEKIKEGIGL